MNIEPGYWDYGSDYMSEEEHDVRMERNLEEWKEETWREYLQKWN